MDTGSEIAGYRIERVLATGGMGTVYLAHHPTLPRLDALKVLDTDLSGEPGFRERFIREADIAAGLNHPNIVSVFNRGDTDGHLWIAMQYVEGTDAEAALHAGAVPPARAIHIVSEIAKALDYAHQRGVVHHDIKPANFLLSADDDEHVLLTDFGVARALEHTETADDAALTATLAYAAPEVIKGDDIGARADIYSLGCTLFRLLTGKQPFFDADGTAALIQAHLHRPPPRISDHLSGRSAQLDWVITKALAKDPAARFGSAREFARAAAAALARTTPATAPPRPPDPDTAPRRAPAGPLPRIPHRPVTPPPAKPATQWAATPPTPPNGAQYAPITITTTPTAPRVSKQFVFGVVFAVVVLGIVTAAIVKLATAPDSTESVAPPPSPTTSAPAPTPTATPQAVLQGLLPPGYPPGACTSVPTPPLGTTAAVTCAVNTDPGGPLTGTYQLAESLPELRAQFNDIVRTSAVVVCPGNIQSPGPWNRKTSPTLARGTVFCGVQNGIPVVAWTNEADLLLSSVQGGVGVPPTLEDVYAWWASHS